MMININPFWFFLIAFIGVVILLVFAYLKKQSYQLNRNIASLYQLNKEVNQDTIEFIKQAWISIQPSSFDGFYAHINWYGTEQRFVFGKVCSHLDIKQVKNQEITIEFGFYNSKQLTGEKRFFSNLLKTTFLQLVESNIQTKINQVLNTQAGLQRAQVFNQHDLKNLIQFIQLLNIQVHKTIDNDQKEALINALKHSLPSVQQRAERILQQNTTTTQNTSKLDPREPVDLNSFINQVIQPIFIPFIINGHAKADVACPKISEAFTNLIANYRDHGLSQVPLHIDITQQDNVVKAVFSRKCSVDQAEQLNENALRLFEPFWSNSSSGMGLGLHIARQTFREHGGDLKHISQTDSVMFEVSLTLNT